MKISQLFIFSILISLLIFSCRNDSVEQEVIDTMGNPTIFQETTVTGLIKDENNNPLSGVDVTINNVKATTDDRGVFLINKTEILSHGTVAVFEKVDYFKNFRTLYIPKPADKLYVEINMTPMGNSMNFLATESAEITMSGGSKVNFSANSIVKESNNEDYTGEVEVFAHWYNPEEIDLGLTGPASLIATDKDGNEKGLYTYGMLAVELRSAEGVELNLKEGSTAMLTFPIPADILSDAPETIPLWFVDEETGVWREEGVAMKQGNEYVGEVKHFSFWNCDVPFDLVDIEGFLLTTDGTPLSNYPVYVKRENLWGAYGYTNNVGYFSGKVPAAELLSLQVWHCGVNLVDQEIGPLMVDTDLGEYTVELTDFATTVTGSMVGCMNEPLADAYGIIYPSRMIIPALDGSFSSVEIGCGAVNLEAQFFHGATLNESEIIPIDKNADFNNLGMVAICNDLQNYIRFSIDGAPYRVIPDPTIAVLNNSEFVLKGRTPGGEFSYEMRVPSIEVGLTNPVVINGFSELDFGGNNDGRMFCQDELPITPNSFPCDQYEVDILEVNLVDNFILGTFNGSLAVTDSVNGGSYLERPIEGSFRSDITKNFDEASISGRAWFDFNNNGTRDTDEEDDYPSLINFNLQKTDGDLEFGRSYASLVDGEYSFENLEPGEYTITAYTYPYVSTNYQVGNPMNDNDYAVSAVGTGYVAEITLGNGEDLTNIDLGLKNPEEVFCNLSTYGCNPNIVLQYNLGGGVPPYSVSLSNGFSDVVSESYATIDIGVGGEYSFTVEDAIGNTCTSIIDVPDYRNSVGGWVWKDVATAGATAGLYDANIDTKMDGITVELYQGDGTFVGTTTSGINGFNGYIFEELPFGEYYVQLDLPAGEELVDVNTSVYNGSSIDPVTLQSEVFDITDCNTYFRKNIGFK